MVEMPNFMKAKEVADLLRIHVAQVYRLDIPQYRVGGAVRYDEAEVRAWLEAHHGRND